MDPTGFLETAASLVERYGLKDLEPQLRACRSLASADGRVDIGIFGRFKAGKSSFLNSLVGQTVLPVGVIPVTAVVTRLRHGPVARAEVAFLDGAREEIPLTQVGEYISESKNPENEKKVATVALDLPSLSHLAGLQLVDTPGLGGAFRHNTAVTLDWLPYAGAALVAVAVDPPLSEQDLALIAELRRYTPRIVILLTKADLVSRAELEEITAFVRGRLNKEFGVELPVHPYSIRPDFGHLRQELAEGLFLPLHRDSGEERRRILAYKLASLRGQTAAWLDLARASAHRADQDLAALKSEILDEKTSLASLKEEVVHLEQFLQEQTRESIGRALRKEAAGLAARLRGELAGLMPTWRVNLWHFTRNFEAWAKEALAREMKALSSQEEPQIVKPLHHAQERFAAVVKGFQGRLAGNIDKVLGLKMDLPEWDIEVATPTAPDVSLSRVFDSHLDLLWFLIPMPLVRPWIERHLLRLAAHEAEKHLIRLTGQWTERINRASHRLALEAVGFITRELETVERLILDRGSEATMIEKDLASLNSAGLD